jgi:two-component sensor histidine kinase
MAPAVPEGWTVGVGDRDGAYVSRSQLHDEMTGKPGLPEYLEKVVGRSGTFTAKNFQGITLLAGYYRSPYSDWFYTANIPLSVVQAPLWRSLVAIGAIGILALLVSSALAYFVGLGMARAAGDLASRAAAVGQGKPVEEMNTTVSEFAVIADALAAAERALVERTHELQAVLETVPAAVWFTYDPHAREVIRNRFAAELMGVPSANRRPFGAPDFVIDTIAFRNGNPVSREDRPLSRAMRGEHTDHEEFTYILLDGVERTLLTSARPIFDTADRIIGAVQISLDISERKRGEEQRKLLLRELNHRVKNTLAVVQSIASQTLNSAGSLQEAGVALTSRLVSLAKAHDMLTQDNWSSTDLRELVIASVTPHAGLERFRIEGDAVRLTPKLTLSIALALHELTTNAIKYGALSDAGGRVAVAWSVAADEARHLRIEWREEGGPEVEPPSRKGFGTRMLGRILDAEPGGGVTIRFEPQGLVCILELDLGATEVSASR